MNDAELLACLRSVLVQLSEGGARDGDREQHCVSAESWRAHSRLSPCPSDRMNPLMHRLQIFTVSTRPSRKGPAVAAWFESLARAHGVFDIELVDLAAINLPVMDEPEHPRLRRYQHAHTKAWSAQIESADAFVFVTPEYNFSAPPSIINALDYLVFEWAYKPVGFVSYGGVSAGVPFGTDDEAARHVAEDGAARRSGRYSVLHESHRRRHGRVRAGRGAEQGGHGDARRARALDQRPRHAAIERTFALKTNSRTRRPAAVE